MSYYIYSTLTHNVNINGVILNRDYGLYYNSSYGKIIEKDYVYTEITDKEYDLVKDSPAFKFWLNEGFLSVFESKIEKDEAYKNMKKPQKLQMNADESEDWRV